jgi:RimK family alpha-L-glutamate ligase
MSDGRVVVLGGPTKANAGLVASFSRLGLAAVLVAPLDARRSVRPSDVALARLDVRRTLDGVEPGLVELLWLERGGAQVLNPVRALLGAHDKLRTSRLLDQARVPHPEAVHVTDASTLDGIEPPVVVKPRFGSWGCDVVRCRNRRELIACAREVRGRSWFRRHGALVEDLVTPRGHDLRVLVAGGRIVGAAQRLAAPGEWRTNVALGGVVRPAVPSSEAAGLALRAVAAVGGDLVGVDLFPLDGGWVVLELNGAVEFDDTYSQPGRDVFADIGSALELGARTAGLSHQVPSPGDCSAFRTRP